jgi:hypothetical protein
MEQQAVRQLRSSEALVAGISAMLLATAVVGLASIVQPSVPFPPLGLAQRLLHVVPGALAVFFIERLGHLALRLFAIGFTLGGILAGGVAGVLVARAPVRSRARACWAAGGVFALLALAGYRSQPGAPSLALYGALIGVAAVVYATGLRGALDRLDRDTVPPAARGLGRTRREFLRAAVGAGGLLALGLGVNRLTGGSGDRGGRPLARPAAMSPAVDRRARLVLRRLDPWSVLKFSVVFYFCLMLISLLVFAVIWFVLVNMGVFEEVTSFAGKVNLEVTFPAGTVFRWYVFAGLLGVVVWSVVTVLLTLLFNLVNDVTGGIEVVLAEREHRPAGR